MTNRTDHQKVFFSYSWISPEHNDIILNTEITKAAGEADGPPETEGEPGGDPE